MSEPRGGLHGRVTLIILSPPPHRGVPDEPIILGLSAERGTIPGTIERHDSGFASISLPPCPPPDDPGSFWSVFANALTAVGNVRSQDYPAQAVPVFPAPMRFSKMLP
jgi:hypothetical protein